MPGTKTELAKSEQSCNLPVADLDVLGKVDYLSRCVLASLRRNELFTVVGQVFVSRDQEALGVSAGKEEQSGTDAPLGLAKLSVVEYPFDFELHI